MRIGTLGAIYRYPVRSMRGESLDEAFVARLGLVGDRAYGVVTPEEFEIASASKSPRAWARLLEFEASYLETPRLDAVPPPIRLVRDRGAALRSDAPGFDDALSRALGVRVSLLAGETGGALAAAAARRRAEESGTPDAVPRVAYASAPVHLVTTASLAALAALHPDGRVEAARFRPNLLVDTGAAEGFAEVDWVGRRLHIGEVFLDVFRECDRCAMTTLPQAGLPRDPGILKAVVDHNRRNLGVVLGVPQPGTLRVGDAVELRDRA